MEATVFSSSPFVPCAINTDCSSWILTVREFGFASLALPNQMSCAQRERQSCSKHAAEAAVAIPVILYDLELAG